MRKCFGSFYNTILVGKVSSTIHRLEEKGV